VPMHQTSHGLAAEIDECLWLDQQQLLAAYLAGAYFCVALPSVKADRMKPGEVIQAPETDIVAVLSISLAGIAQTNYELH